ncbi:MAG TPA: formate dehydrogenase accessory sulfurtransferase FdhD, partial [Pseudoneobacillus sp.]|nr:formate dehydrogenase accessory sulfurtransferase FdhD [Pseudoneobacillus sp.]
MKHIEIKRTTLRYENGWTERNEDRIVTEYPVTIKVNGQELVTMICSPEFIEDMVIGFLAS